MPTVSAQTQYLQAIKSELALDPAGLGYAGKTAQQQADLMNNSYFVPVPQIQTARIAVIIGGIPFAPNSVTSSDITASAGV